MSAVSEASAAAGPVQDGAGRATTSAALARPATPVVAEAHAPGSGFWKLTFGTLGVVYGDIGTSPLYALKESLKAASTDGKFGSEEVLGVLSLILWALVIIVTAKYVFIMLRADNHGEGGTLTLMALAQRVMGRGVVFVPILGIIGAS